MKETLTGYVRYVRADEKTMKRLYLISLVMMLLLLSLLIRNGLEGGSYLVNEEGEVIGIERKSLESFEEYDLTLRVEGALGEEEKEVVISKSIVNPESPEETEKREQDEEESDARERQELEIQNLISDIEDDEEKRILFPRTLSDGSTLTWTQRPRGPSEIPYLLIVYGALLGICIKASLDRDRLSGAEDRESIRKGLPRFVNQLVMLMSAGMILSDSFERITESYALIPKEQQNPFEKGLSELAERNRDHAYGTAVLLNEYAAGSNVKEMLRISAILIENEKRGSDVIENLTRESRFLWEERKITAIERGKMIDARMAYPLGLLLILLIVITMAPAILAMR